MSNTIFVAIASYLDYEIKHTILDCINKATNPDKLYFGVCLQFDDNEGTSEDCIDELVNKYNVKVSKHHYGDSQGGCWARNIAQTFFEGQQYSLQVDSHTRFIQGWDTHAISDYELLKSQGKKPIISFLPPSYFRNDDAGIDYEFKHLENINIIHVPKFTSITEEYWPRHEGYSNEIDTNNTPLPVVILYGGFVFSDGAWVVDVEQDPDHYYTGEEFALTLRSFTKGYGIYTPSKILAWHRCHPKGNKKHFNNNEEVIVNQKHRAAIDRLKLLIEGGDLGKYGLGTVRTLENYEEYAGISLSKKQVYG